MTTTFRPQGPRVVAIGVAVILLVLTVAIAMSLSAEIRSQFSWIEVFTLLLLLVVAWCGLYAVVRSFVRVLPDGLHVRNGYRDHHLAWADIEGVSFGPGAPWPTLQRTDGETVMLFAIQGSDGPPARKAVDEIRGWLQ